MIKESITQVGVSTASTTGVLTTVTQDPSVQNVMVALLSSVVIQVILRVSDYFQRKRADRAAAELMRKELEKQKLFELIDNENGRKPQSESATL
ncbi:hypothetical protein [Parapedobacter sp. 2B3]|uniref:hypothetical protein n=1 Tax=Parapedobacter sp. 2B3 TaxID=3342381 RepID=UPI0035B66F8C